MTQIRNYAHNLYSAGQPTPGQLQSLAGEGVRTIINLRAPGESASFDEASEAARLGLRYVSIPVAGAADLVWSTIECFAKALQDARAHGGTLIHCASANRVGALVALEHRWIRGASLEDALIVGRRAGLAGLEPAVTLLLDA